MKTLLFLTFLLFYLPTISYALPVDWHGVFGVDSAYIDTYRRIDAPHQQSTGIGTQEVPLASGEHANASFQTYLLKLSPEVIVNDSSTFKAEFSTGYGRGGRLGDSSGTDKGNDMANALYHYNTNQQGTTLQVNQFNMTLFSDTATYIIGRHSFSWALGAVINDGRNIWDRLLYIRDGLTAKFKIGNFELAPFLSKLSSTESLTKATKGKEYGVSFLYDNPDKDLAFGLYYSKKQNNSFNSTVKTDIQNTGSDSPLGQTDTKLTDFYLKKSFKKFSVQAEVPIVSGELGNLYNNGSKAKYSAKAFIFETKYDFSDTFSLFANFGSVSGHSGIESSYEAMYLNPNYQIANLLFRYNLYAVSDQSSAQAKNVFDTYITNANFLKLASILKSERSVWTFSVIHAIANEAALAGSKAYNHETNKLFDATQNQDDNLGTELDVDFDYRWNNETHLGTSLGYLFTGDYYSFTNTGTQNSAKNSFVFLVKSSLEF